MRKPSSCASLTDLLARDSAGARDGIRARRFENISAFERHRTRMLTAASTADAPWYVIPADRKWSARTAIGDIVTAALDGLGVRYPHLDGDAADAQSRLRARSASEPAT